MTMDALTALRACVGDLAVEVREGDESEPKVVVSAGEAAGLLARMRSGEGGVYDGLFDLTAIDRGPAASPRFEVVYRLRASETGVRARVHVPLDDEEMIDTVVPLWPVAAWLEREVADLFGIRFRSHPGARPLLLPAGFEGAPLRKDFERQPGRPLPKRMERGAS